MLRAPVLLVVVSVNVENTRVFFAEDSAIQYYELFCLQSRQCHIFRTSSSCSANTSFTVSAA